MFKFKQSLAACAGLALLLGAIAVIPKETAGQKATAQPQPVPPPLNVNVVNSSLPVRTEEETALIFDENYSVDTPDSFSQTLGPVDVRRFKQIRVVTYLIDGSVGVQVRPFLAIDGSCSLSIPLDASFDNIVAVAAGGGSGSRTYDTPGHHICVFVSLGSGSSNGRVQVYGRGN